MYRNGTELMTCSSCHDAHGNDKFPKPLTASPADNSICTSCHSQPVYTSPADHVAEKTGNRHNTVGSAALLCTACHMVKTAASGAQSLGLLDDSPALATPVQYLQGDISSHRFKVPVRAAAALQPTASTLACASCHSTFLTNP